jgi:glycosyltransferase involved in cell wall biosynthesis
MSAHVSIILPTYNSEKFIHRSIKSVLNQTYKNWELIIVDDASTDSTKEIIKNYEKEYKKIRSILLEENSGGPAKPFNIGIRNSDSKFIAFLESDDEWLPEKLEKQIEVFEKITNVGLVSCFAFRIFPNGTKKLYKTPYLGLFERTKWKIFWEKLGIISPSTVIIKREIVEKIGFFDEKIKAGADLDFYLRCIKEFDFYFIDEPLVNYYESEESLSKKQFWKKWIPEYEYILEKYEKDFKKCKKAKSRFLRTLATCYLLEGNLEKSRKYLLEAILNHPTNFRLYPQFLLTLVPRLYKKILFLKRKSF